jgi:hypothetical protein
LTALAVINNATNIAFTLAASIIIAQAFRIVLPVAAIGTGSSEPSPAFFFAPTLARGNRIESGAKRHPIGPRRRRPSPNQHWVESGNPGRIMRPIAVEIIAPAPLECA